jgi:MFS family permease
MRAFQGAAVGMAVACAPALIATVSAPAQKARMLAVYSAAVSAGFMIGPLAGGVLVQLFGWEGVFLFRVVLSALVLVHALQTVTLKI